MKQGWEFNIRGIENGRKKVDNVTHAMPHTASMVTQLLGPTDNQGEEMPPSKAWAL